STPTETWWRSGNPSAPTRRSRAASPPKRSFPLLMRILDDLEAAPPELTASVVTVGKFFAVHVGHQALIRAARERAAARGAVSVVLTFDRHPREILSPGTTFPLLTTLEERLERIAALGVDYAALVRLDA